MRRMVRMMTDEELRLAQDAITREQATRRKLDASPEKIEHAISQYQKSMGREDGDKLTYQGTVYAVLQDHTSASHWTPDTVASLYEKVDES